MPGCDNRSNAAASGRRRGGDASPDDGAHTARRALPKSRATRGVRVFVAETFVSLQGEGTLAGVPSFFIRTSGCNLRCAWCDSRYASWEPEGERRTVASLVAEAAESGIRHVVVTGGEPLLQREIGALTAALVTRHHVTVETAGTLAPNFDCHLLSVSPKTTNSDPAGRWRGRHAARRADLAPLVTLLARHPEYQIKFVVQGDADMAEVLGVVECTGADPARVMLMPEGCTVAEIAGRAAEIGRLCLRHGFRYSPRLHLDLFGGGRGV
jgi:7-carboxy-7-deazaguanine synthase